MLTMINKLDFSQIKPISSLPRNYAALLKWAQQTGKPVIFLRRNKPIAAFLDWKLFKKLIEFQEKEEEREALKNILRSEKEFRAGQAKVLKSLAHLK